MFRDETKNMVTYVFLADGFEEAEAIVPVDMLIRAGAEVKTVSVSDDIFVKGAHGIIVKADIYAKDVEIEHAEMIVLPGGSAGTEALAASQWIKAFIEFAVNKGTYIAAICAAPSVPGRMGLLDGRSIACYPGYEKYMPAANVTGNKVELDDIFITAQGAGVAYDFAFKIVEVLCGNETVDNIKQQIKINQ